MTRRIFGTLSLLLFGLLLGAWLHARFGKPTVEGGSWDVAMGLAMVTWVLKVEVINADPRYQRAP